MKKLIILLSAILLLAGCITITDPHTGRQARPHVSVTYVHYYYTGIYGWYNPFLFYNWHAHYYPWYYQGYGYSGNYIGSAGKARPTSTPKTVITKGSLKQGEASKGSSGRRVTQRTRPSPPSVRTRTGTRSSTGSTSGRTASSGKTTKTRVVKK